MKTIYIAHFSNGVYEVRMNGRIYENVKRSSVQRLNEILNSSRSYIVNWTQIDLYPFPDMICEVYPKY